jgi:hypothetical protein
MTTTINASTTAGLVQTADTSGVLALQTAGTTALTLDASQNATLAGTLTTTGITNSGVATATRFNPTGSSVTGNGMYLPAANSLGLSTNGTNAVYIDSSQNVGIGTTSPAVKLHVAKTTGSGYVSYLSSGVNVSGSDNGLFIGGYDENSGSKLLNIQTNTITPDGAGYKSRFVVQGDGSVLVGTTSAYSGGSKLMVSGATSSTNPLVLQDTGTTYSTGNFFAFFVNSTSASSGSIAHTGATTVAYQTSSDQRLKENIVNAPSALSSLESMKVRSYDWKEDKKHVTYGFVAQEIKEYAPEIVAIGDDNETITDPRGTWGVEYGRLTPMLVKAIQELKAINDQQAETINAQSAALAALTARITALEGN